MKKNDYVVADALRKALVRADVHEGLRDEYERNIHRQAVMNAATTIANDLRARSKWFNFERFLNLVINGSPGNSRR